MSNNAVATRPFALHDNSFRYFLGGVLWEERLHELDLSKVNAAGLCFKYHQRKPVPGNPYSATTFVLLDPNERDASALRNYAAYFDMHPLLNCCGAVIVSRVTTKPEYFDMVDDLICQLARLGLYTGMIASAVPTYPGLPSFQDFLEATGWSRVWEFKNNRYGRSGNIIGIYTKESGYKYS